MKKLTLLNLFIGLAIILASCGTSNNVVSNRLITKRKYTKGFHIKNRGIFRKSNDDLAKNEERKNDARRSNDESYEYVAETPSNEREIEYTSEVSETNAVSETYETTESVDYANGINTMGTDDDQAIVESVQDEDEALEIESHEESSSDIRSSLNSMSSLDTSDPVVLILLIILALIIPPLAIFLYRGADRMFLIDLILFLVGIFSFWWVPFTGLFLLAAVVLAILVLLDVV